MWLRINETINQPEYASSLLLSWKNKLPQLTWSLLLTGGVIPMVVLFVQNTLLIVTERQMMRSQDGSSAVRTAAGNRSKN